IGNRAFYDCKRLAALENGKAMESIGDYAFYATGFRSIVIPDSVTSIGEFAFSECANLTDITISNKLNMIGRDAFYYCKSLEKVHIASVEKWCAIYFKNEYANPLYYADLYLAEKKVTNLVIPDSVRYISAYAFYSAENIESVKIGKAVESIGYYAFEKCQGIKKVHISNGIEQWCEIHFDNLTSNPIYYGADLYLNGKKVTDVDTGSADHIDPCAFYGYKSLKTVKINNGVEELENHVFAECTGLVSVTISYTVKSVDVSAFRNCTSLEEVTIYSVDCVLNKNCGLNYNQIIYAFKGSTAEAFAKDCGAWFQDVETVHKHTYKTVSATKATLTSNGKTEIKCPVCGKVKSTQTIAKISSVTLSATKYIYDGNNKTPAVTVKDANGKTLVKNTDYKVSVASKRSGIGKYTVKVTFIGKYEGTKNVYFTILPGKPATVKASSQTTSSVKLTWSEVSGAAGYTVYRYSPSKKAYVKAGTTEGTSLTVKGLLAGTKYTFKVVAYGKTSGGKVYNSEGYTLLKTATKTKTPELTKVTASSTKGKAYVYHSNVSGETGYTVYYSTSKTSGFKKYNNFKADTTRCDITKLTSGKTYYFKVRTYIKTDSGYVYSPWSAVKGIKVK
ncbi:MAG: leucine-rich repeat protein, partial [Clostridia bacterium]|nr:leucine-rich repeat protein [Clostridia bacterium]